MPLCIPRAAGQAPSLEQATNQFLHLESLVPRTCSKTKRPLAFYLNILLLKFNTFSTWINSGQILFFFAIVSTFFIKRGNLTKFYCPT